MGLSNPSLHGATSHWHGDLLPKAVLGSHHMLLTLG